MQSISLVDLREKMGVQGVNYGKTAQQKSIRRLYKRYDNKYIYVVAVIPDVDTGSQVVIFHEGIDACECKYYSMTKQSFCEMVNVDGEWVDKFTRQPQIKITNTHIQNLNDGGFEGPVRKKKLKDEDLLVYESRRYRRAETYTAYAKYLCTNYKIDLCRYNLCVAQKRYIGVSLLSLLFLWLVVFHQPSRIATQAAIKEG